MEIVSSVFGALAHPIRRAILEFLRQGEANLTELAEAQAGTQVDSQRSNRHSSIHQGSSQVSLQAMRKHLSVLEEAGLVRRRRAGREVYFTLCGRPSLAAAARTFNHMVEYRDDETVSSVFAALAHPVRRAILERLCQSEANLTELADVHAISVPAMHRHLSVLETAGLARRRKAGREVYYTLSGVPSLAAASHWVEELEAFWEPRLDRLGEYLRPDQ